jgi:hypothetical protein
VPTVVAKISKSQLRDRHGTYLVDRLLNLHNMIASVALGVAGLAAASLIVSPKEFRDYQIMFWILWTASLLAVATAYAGAIIGSIFLPTRMPAISDLLIPLSIGVFEFLLFGILAHKATGLISPASVTAAWFFSFSGFGIFAAGAVWRASRIIDPSSFASDISSEVHTYVRGLHMDIAAASTLAGVSFTAGIGNIWIKWPISINYVFAVVVTAGLVGALATHAATAKSLRKAFD